MAQIISVLRKDKKAVLVDSSLLRLATDKSGVMVRIVDKSGSAPRSTGSMMFVTQQEIAGTVGGGSVENHAIERAKKMLNTHICVKGIEQLLAEYRLRHSLNLWERKI